MRILNVFKLHKIVIIIFNGSDMESAKGILSVMQQAGLEPSADTYTTLLSGFARRGDVESIKTTLEECETKEIYLLDKDFLDIIFSLSTNGHNEHVPFLLSKVRKSVGYNQDAINLILRLINYGQEETAMEILKTVPQAVRPDGQQVPFGNFFIRQMVKAKRPVEKIISVCKYLQENNLNENALSYATEMSLENSDSDLAYALLEELQKQGITVRQHFFWPLLVSKGKQKNVNGILDILSKMTSFNLTPNSETVRDYVLPYMSGKIDDILDKLRTAGISIGSAATSLSYKYLCENKIEDAAQLCKRIRAYYSPALLRRPLSHAYLKTNDLDSYIKIVRQIYENFDRREEIRTTSEETEETQNRADKTDIIGHFVLEFTYIYPKNMVQIIENVLQGLVKEGLSMSSSYAEKIQDRLGEKLTPEISMLLGKMTSGELTPVEIEKEQPVYTPSSAMNIPQLERLIANLEAKKENTNGLKRQLLTLYTRAKDLEKTESLLKKLESGDFTYTVGIYAQLIDLYTHHEKLDDVLNIYKKIKEIEPDIGLDESKVIRVATLMITNDKFDDSITFISEQSRSRKQEEKSFSYNTLCWRLLNSLAENGKVDELNTLFDTLVENEFIEVSNVLLGPLVKVHIVNKDLKKALEKFEWCVTQYKVTPWKNDLACKMIQNEDAESLQRMTDLSTIIHGEVNSLYDLVFAFVECGRIRQARKILETPGLQSRPQRLNSACERYQEEGLVQPLEGLKEATKDLNHIDRSDIYYQLLLSYIKKNDADKALGLWTQMQEEDMQPTDEFLLKLNEFLKKNGRDVPFVVPSVNSSMEAPRSNIGLFRQHLKDGQTQTALNLKNSVTNQLNVNDYSALLENLVKEERHNEASKLCFEMLKKNIHPIPRVFRFYLNKVANSGDVQTIESIGNKLSSDMKKLLSFDNRLCHANIVAGKAEQYLETLTKEIENCKDEHVSIMAEKFPRGGAVGILEKCPELTNKCK